MASKERIDVLLTKKELFPSRNKAQRAIMAGEIFVNNRLVDKPGTKVAVDAKIEVKGDTLPYVSRGGLKLEKALEIFTVNPKGKVAIDIGASTGGFTDCLLQKKAKRVYTVDVGYGQLAWKLRQDERVKVIERTNFRYIEKEQLPVKVPLIVTDVSFISLRLIIPKALEFLEVKGDIIALIKPQFEAGKDKVGKKGIVRDKKIHQEVITKLSQFFDTHDLILKGLDFSPITGASSKNIEYLIHLKKSTDYENDLFKWGKKIEDVIKRAHKEL
ncbi:MAG TPA: TlyA family RNA methyltransferase [Halanaerobiales bacterium]|nr:TlyA family RNA methyltransferase [Halanaerobiales bacterium]